MSTASLIAFAIAVAAVLFVGFIVWRETRTGRLRRRFGPEYDRVRQRYASRTKAERELLARERRFGGLDIRPLDPAARKRYETEWRQVQEEFVDHPQPAVRRADQLVTTVMAERGYPTRDFAERTASLSVDRARTLDHYRRGRAISTRARTGWSSTEELRQAMVHFRALFTELLESPGEPPGEQLVVEPADERDHERRYERPDARGRGRAPETTPETVPETAPETVPDPAPEPMVEPISEPTPEPAYGHGRGAAGRRHG